VYAKCPDRKLKEGAIRDFFPGIRDQLARLLIVAYSKAGAELAFMVNGIRRRRASAALGFASILCLHLNRDEADACGIP
jgi:hypothetical protein